jgi:hypothetical protein
VKHIFLTVTFLILVTACAAKGNDSLPSPVLHGQISEPLESGSLLPKYDLFEAAGDSMKSSFPEKSHFPKQVLQALTSIGNFALDLRGFDWSIESANVALEENGYNRSANAKEFIKRKSFDQKELELLYGIFQIAEGLGFPAGEKQTQIVDSSAEKLGALIGKARTEEVLIRLFANANQPSPPMVDENWSVEENRRKLERLVSAAIENDAVIKNLLGRMHKYNSHGNLARISAKVVYTTLGIASFTPTFVAPAAEASLLAFITATGGPEQDKLLREMYLQKCLESRYKTITEEAHLVLTSAQLASFTGNSSLRNCSVDLARHMTDESVVQELFPHYELPRLSAAIEYRTIRPVSLR